MTASGCVPESAFDPFRTHCMGSVIERWCEISATQIAGMFRRRGRGIATRQLSRLLLSVPPQWSSSGCQPNTIQTTNCPFVGLMSDASIIEHVLKRDRTIVLASLAAIAGLGAIYTIFGVGRDMSALHMTAMSSHMLMTPAVWTPGYAVLVFFMWWIMMIAMMLPSAAPTVLLYAAIKRQRRDIANPLALTATFLSAYLAVWALFSLFAASLQWVLELVGFVSAMMSVSSRALGGLILIAAAIYQFTPLKQTCLKQCQNPVRLLTGPQQPGLKGALRMGLRHGAYCVGCCAFLMILLFFGGIMNLFWITGLAIYVLLEKLLPYGRWVGYTAGIGLFGGGALLLLSVASAD